jgi:hypothetical protein
MVAGPGTPVSAIETVVYPVAVIVIPTEPALVGSVYVVEAVPVLSVIAVGWLNVPPATLALKFTVTPDTPFP